MKISAGSFLIALTFTLLVWGIVLTPTYTITSEAQSCGIIPFCRAGGPDLSCQYGNRVGNLAEDPPAVNAQEIPADYYLRLTPASKESNALPKWDPYAASGHPIFLDGHNNPYSPTRWLLRKIPGDQGRDVLVFLRILIWTWGVALSLLLFEVAKPLVAVLAFAATVAPYAVFKLDHNMLDIDLLAPWATVLVIATGRGFFPLRWALLPGFFLGLLMGSLGFAQSQFTFFVALGLIAAFASPAFHKKPILVCLAIAAGFLAIYPAWFPFFKYLDQFISSRTVANSCQARNGLSWSQIFSSFLTLDRNFHSALGAIGGYVLILSTVKDWKYLFPLAALGVFTLWSVHGAPYFCSLPFISGVYFERHFSPYAQFYFLLCAGIAAQTFLGSQKKHRPLFLFIALLVALFAAQRSEAREAWVLRYVGVLSACLIFYFSGWDRFPRWRSVWVVIATLMLVLPQFTKPQSYLKALASLRLPGELPPHPSILSPKSALGAVQDYSMREDRRHFSPTEILFPNWSSAFRILDIRFLGALHAKSFYALNSEVGLFGQWSGDPGYGYTDRFVRTEPPSLAFSPEFQRVLILNRISLFSFQRRQSFLSETPGPYERKNCRPIGDSWDLESYICPEVGGVGYFPKHVETSASQENTLKILKSVSLSTLKELAVILGEESFLPAVGNIKSFERLGDTLTYELEVSSPGLFVIADTWFPGWRATVNGREEAILNANIAFKAVSVSQGKVTLKLAFLPE
jgi:hypothetical protein